MTDVTDRPTDLDRPRRRSRTLAVALIALAVIVVLVVVVAVVVTDGDETGSELPEEAAQVLDDYRNAWVNQDVDAFWASITDDFFAREYPYWPGRQILFKEFLSEPGPSDIAREIEFRAPRELIEVRDVIVWGDGPWIVTAHEVWNRQWTGIRSRWEGNVTRVIVERDGSMKIASVLAAGSLAEAEN